MSYIVFDTPGLHSFVYDRETNRVILIPHADAESLHQALQTGETNPTLQKYQQKGICCPSILKGIEHPTVPMMEEIASSQLEDLLLQVTQNCNLRCEYCTYSGKYYNRTHSTKHMSFEVASRSVDFFMERAKDKNSVVIGFYGGEPLLEFELIKRVVSYVEENYSEKKVSYGMTTNGTLLTEEAVSFLIEKHFNIIISLDGPKDQHDKYRRFVSGKGSFDVVMENMQRIRTQHPVFYQNLRTNTVVTPDKDLEALEAFLNKDEQLEGITPGISMLNDSGNKEEFAFGPENRVVNERERAKLMLYLLDQIEEAQVAKTHRRYLDDLIFLCKTNQSIGKMTETAHHAGPCTVGVRKTFVDVQGNIYPCEKVGEVPAMRLGNVFEGFDLERVKRLTNIGALSEPECKECWALHHCTICLCRCIDKDVMSREAKLRHCAESKAEALTKMRDLCFLQMEGLDFEKLRSLQMAK